MWSFVIEKWTQYRRQIEVISQGLSAELRENSEHAGYMLGKQHVEVTVCLPHLIGPCCLRLYPAVRHMHLKIRPPSFGLHGKFQACLPTE